MRRLNHHLTCWNSQALGQRSVLQEFPAANKGLDVRVIIIAIVLIVLAATAVVLVYPRPSAPSGNGSSNNNGSNGNGTNGNGSGSNTNSPTQSMRFQAASASDRDFPGQVAYTIMVPEGWVGQPNVERYTNPFGGADFNFTAHDSTGNSRIFFSSADFPYYVEPTQGFLSVANYIPNACYDAVARSFATCAQGNWWLACGQNGCYNGMKLFINSYLSATGYIASITQGGLHVVLSDNGAVVPLNRALWPIVNSVHSDVRIEKILNDPSLVNRVLTLDSGQNTGAEAVFTYSDGGVQYEYLLQVVVTRFTVPSLGFSSWTTYFWGYSAPKSDFQKVGRLFSMIIPTVKVNSQWLQAEIQRLGSASQLIAQHNARMNQMDYAMFKAQEQSQFTVGEGWIDALGGVKEIVNPDNAQDTYRVPIDYTYYWHCSGSAYPWYGTDSSLDTPTGCTLFQNKAS